MNSDWILLQHIKTTDREVYDRLIVLLAVLDTRRHPDKFVALKTEFLKDISAYLSCD